MTTLQRYNGLDSIATLQLWDVLKEKLASDPEAAATYRMHKALSAPYLYAMTRGILVDVEGMANLRNQFEVEIKHIEAILDFFTRPLLGGVINLASSSQVMWMFRCFGAELASSDREAVEQLEKSDPELAPLCRLVTHWRDRSKMLSVLQPHLYDRDNRMRCTYKIAGTVTDRLSSSKNCLWTGMNMQNIKRDEDEEATGHASIRSIFVADPGYKLINVDIKGADSWAVGFEVFASNGDESYLNALRSFDIHTYVSSLVWRHLGWTGEPKHDRALAKQFFYRQYDYRFMSKKGGHGSNYVGSPWGLARQMKVPVAFCEQFQRSYFKAFPGIPKWHKAKAQQLQTTGKLRNLFGRRRNFHGRLDSDSTLREAIGWLGQSVTAAVCNRGLLKAWPCILQMPDLDLQFLAQVHDSLLFQVPEANVEEALELLAYVLPVSISATSPDGRSLTYSIPLEFSTGFNWAAESPNNPDGQREFTGIRDDRQRQRTPSQTAPSGRLAKRLSNTHRRNIKPTAVPQMGGTDDDWSMS